jgi:xanthine dehydrogenase accessory factor
VELAQAVADLLTRGERAALATVVRVSGSTPQQVGARLLRYPDGRTLGTVGGGHLEHAVLEALARCLVAGVPRTVAWDLARDLGMCCGGRMEVLVEPLEGMARLIMVGAGHVACATAALAQRVGFRVSVVDEREELNHATRFSGCELMLAAPDEALKSLGVTAQDWVLILTHDHQLDERALEAVLRGPHRYVGMIGSRRKVLRILERVRARHPNLDLSRLHAPVGLDLGALGPDEIAVSIVGELIALRRGREAAHMRSLLPVPVALANGQGKP